MLEKTLKPEYQELADEWDYLYGDGCCYCSATSMPPCSWCESSGTHDGNEEALADNPDAWEDTLISAVRYYSNEKGISDD